MQEYPLVNPEDRNQNDRAVVLYIRTKGCEGDAVILKQRNELDGFCKEQNFKRAVPYVFIGRAVQAGSKDEIEKLCQFAAENNADQVIVTKIGRRCRDLEGYIKVRDIFSAYGISLQCLDNDMLDDKLINSLCSLSQSVSY